MVRSIAVNMALKVSVIGCVTIEAVTRCPNHMADGGTERLVAHQVTIRLVTLGATGMGRGVNFRFRVREMTLAVAAVVDRDPTRCAGQTVMVPEPVAAGAAVIAQVGKRRTVFVTVNAGAGGAPCVDGGVTD